MRLVGIPRSGYLSIESRWINQNRQNTVEMTDDVFGTLVELLKAT